jgi:hypothetical protein
LRWLSIPEAPLDPSKTESQVASISTIRAVDKRAPPSLHDIAGDRHEPDVHEAQPQHEARELLRLVKPRLMKVERSFLPIPE